MKEQEIRAAVRERYGRLATTGASCCGGESPVATVKTSCCESAPITFIDGREVPEDIAGASLGCGAPIDAAGLHTGETVVDLGSGAGLDAFFAAERVGPTGRAIGVDMTPEMIAKSRDSAHRLGVSNVEFRLGEIEHLPLADGVADAVISNCVINLLPEKRPAFAEAFRVLKPGGRMVVSDIVSGRPLPDWFKTAERWAACLGGAIPETEYLKMVASAGFTDVEVVSKRTYAPGMLFSITVRATKPRPAGA